MSSYNYVLNQKRVIDVSAVHIFSLGTDPIRQNRVYSVLRAKGIDPANCQFAVIPLTLAERIGYFFAAFIVIPFSWIFGCLKERAQEIWDQQWLIYSVVPQRTYSAAPKTIAAPAAVLRVHAVAVNASRPAPSRVVNAPTPAAPLLPVAAAPAAPQNVAAPVCPLDHAATASPPVGAGAGAAAPLPPVAPAPAAPQNVADHVPPLDHAAIASSAVGAGAAAAPIHLVATAPAAVGVEVAASAYLTPAQISAVASDLKEVEGDITRTQPMIEGEDTFGFPPLIQGLLNDVQALRKKTDPTRDDFDKLTDKMTQFIVKVNEARVARRDYPRKDLIREMLNTTLGGFIFCLRAFQSKISIKLAPTQPKTTLPSLTKEGEKESLRTNKEKKTPIMTALREAASNAKDAFASIAGSKLLSSPARTFLQELQSEIEHLYSSAYKIQQGIERSEEYSVEELQALRIQMQACATKALNAKRAASHHVGSTEACTLEEFENLLVQVFGLLLSTETYFKMIPPKTTTISPDGAGAGAAPLPPVAATPAAGGAGASAATLLPSRLATDSRTTALDDTLAILGLPAATEAPKEWLDDEGQDWMKRSLKFLVDETKQIRNEMDKATGDFPGLVKSAREELETLFTAITATHAKIEKGPFPSREEFTALVMNIIQLLGKISQAQNEYKRLAESEMSLNEKDKTKLQLHRELVNRLKLFRFNCQSFRKSIAPRIALDKPKTGLPSLTTDPAIEKLNDKIEKMKGIENYLKDVLHGISYSWATLSISPLATLDFIKRLKQLLEPFYSSAYEMQRTLSEKQEYRPQELAALQARIKSCVTVLDEISSGKKPISTFIGNTSDVSLLEEFRHLIVDVRSELAHANFCFSRIPD